jgi:membrane protease YdiL (CAAX protease family)
LDPEQIENLSSEPAALPSLPADPQPRSIAPAWHTAVLIAVIVSLSATSAWRYSTATGKSNLLASYGATGVMELCLLAWVAFGMRMRKVKLRSLLGNLSGGIRSIAIDLGIAALFWIGSLMVLGTLSLTWLSVDAAIHHKSLLDIAGGSAQASSSEQQTMRTFSRLAPSNGEEIAAWILLCLIAGTVEEVVFRGYLQRQFTHWARGGVAAGVLLSALCFGSAHAYEGARGMFLIAVFGLLFSLLALYRGNLRAGMFAHIWHDLIAGLALALLKSRHLI